MTFLRILVGYYLAATILLSSCVDPQQHPLLDLESTPWDTIVNRAAGSEVQFMMWQGSPAVNAYINDYLAPTLKEKYDIALQVTGGQGPEIVQLIMGEKQAHANTGQVDFVWINGETFFQLRQLDGLWGPFVQALPNAEYIDFDNPFINTDFQQPVDNMECPWSITQFVMVHDSARVPSPPANMADLRKFVEQYPGTFTISNDFSGMTLLKSMLAELSGSPDGLNGPFDEEKYERLSGRLWSYINELKPYLWKQGETFPKEQTKMDQLFATGELMIAYGFSEGSIDDKVDQGLYTSTSRAYPWHNGTIRNTNYLGITYNAPNKEAALVAINHMISAEAQLEKADPSGMDANTVLDVDRLPTDWQRKFALAPKRKYGTTMAKLAPYAIQEPDPQYMLRLYDDFRTFVIEQ